MAVNGAAAARQKSSILGSVWLAKVRTTPAQRAEAKKKATSAAVWYEPAFPFCKRKQASLLQQRWRGMFKPPFHRICPH